MYNLMGMLKMDEGCFEVSTKEGTELKRGKGSPKQRNVAVIAESTPFNRCFTKSLPLNWFFENRVDFESKK
jgi:hypothetical protein